MLNNTRYVYGDQNVQIPAHINFGKFILDQLRNKTDEVAIENGQTGEKLTYKELTEYAIKLSVALTKLGVKKGDVVALGSEKRLFFLPTALAIVFSGAAYTPYDFTSGRAHLQHKMSITQPKYFICSELFWNTNYKILKSFESIKSMITLDNAPENIASVGSLIDAIDVDVDLFEPVPVQGQIDTAFIMYSSGTTGMPKGILVTHMNVILRCINSSNDVFDDSLKVTFITGDWFHEYDSLTTYIMLGLGKKIVYATDYTPDTVIRTLEKHQVNIVVTVPSLVNWLSIIDENENCKLDSLKIVYCCASPLHVKTMDKLKQRFPSIKMLMQGYGMTEVGWMTSELWARKGLRAGSVGTASPSITLKVVHPQTRSILGPNQHGEICLRGPTLMKGYINVDPATYLDDNGFFQTGDLGYYDDDGYFYIVDRIKEIIKYDGYNIAPLELETILQQHPGVREAGVVGKPVEVYGEGPIAFVVLQPGSDVTEKELVDFVAKEVAPYMQLKGGVRFISQLPMNTRGKILRRKLREMLIDS